jgi:eukaryotic-like serine/threonine-protein kinase
MSELPNDPKTKRLHDVTRPLSLDPSVEDPSFRTAGDLDFELTTSPEAVADTPKEIVLGDYLILDKIGAGGMGQVYRAKHRTMDRDVAIKILPSRLAKDMVAVERFQSEVRAQAKLLHPNIVAAFDAGCQEFEGHKVHYLVMELIQGESLAQRIAAQGPLSTSDVLTVLRQSALALHCAHSLGVVHRDIKPGNMMLTPDGTLKILDFGLAVLRELREMRDGGNDKLLVGTVEFMSPEQINTPKAVDHRSDLYSLGATLYYMLTGAPMFTGELIQTALAQIHRRPMALYEVRGDIDLRLDSVFQWLVAKNVQDRCPSAQDLLEKLYTLNLIERPGSAVTSRSEISRSMGLVLDRPTSLGRITSSSIKAYEPIGIELGMIHSRVSFVNSEHKIEQVTVDEESTQLRNMLFSDAERIAIGSRAVSERVQHPERIFYGLQRWYGLPMLEKSFGGRRVPPEVLVATVIRQLVVATRCSRPNASHAVVTIPGCYDQMHRISTKTACGIAGIEVLQLLEKPLAAALAHIEIESRLASARGDVEWEKTMLVVMLTGAACEAAVVHADLRGVQKLSLVGDWKRGTLRWQDRAAKQLASLIESQYGLSAREDLNLASQLQRTIEKAMERLRQSSVVPFIVDMAKGRYENALVRDRIQDWVGDLASDCYAFAAESVRRANLDRDAIDSLLLIGDICWLDRLRNPLQDLIKPGGSVVEIDAADMARGAALQAKYLMPPMDPRSPVAKSATSYDLGMIVQDQRTSHALPKVLIPKDSPSPFHVSRTLRFSHEGQRQPVLQWVEGTRFGEQTWHKLSSVDLQTCFEERTTADPIQLRAEIDESGIWNGSLTWLAGTKQLALPPLAEPIMDSVSMRQWHDWLESIMLCNLEPR